VTCTITGATGEDLRSFGIEPDAMLRGFEEGVARTATSAGARVVSLPGDEAMFVAGSPAEAATIACALVTAPDLPELRVGRATGAVLTRGGDVFGPPSTSRRGWWNLLYQVKCSRTRSRHGDCATSTVWR